MTQTPLLMSLHDTVHARLQALESFSVTVGTRSWTLTAALPNGYAKARRQRYPLLLLVGAGDMFGSAVEMTRLLPTSREARACVVVNLEGVPADDAALLAALAAECARRYRIESGEVAVFAHAAAAQELLFTFAQGIAGVDRCMLALPQPDAGTRSMLDALRSAPQLRLSCASLTALDVPLSAQVNWKVLPESRPAALAVPALMHGLRSFWGSKHSYGDEALPLTRPAVERLLRVLAPLLRPLTGRRVFAPESGNPYVVRSQAMSRDFEVFVTLPEGLSLAGARRYPALISLDANGGFATMAETFARLIKAGEMAPAILVGIGTPRSQGDAEFGYRRFEECSPPVAPGYDYNDTLGRFFRALFSLRGQQAAAQLGQAVGFHQFLAQELMPLLQQQFPIDAGAVSLLGHSAAGAFVGYALAQAQSPFASFMCLSPGVAISNNWMLDNAGGRTRPARVYASVGAEELSNRFNAIAGIPRTREYADLLRRHSAYTVEYHALEGETHTTVYARAVAQSLCTLISQGVTEAAAA